MNYKLLLPTICCFFISTLLFGRDIPQKDFIFIFNDGAKNYENNLRTLIKNDICYLFFEGAKDTAYINVKEYSKKVLKEKLKNIKIDSNVLNEYLKGLSGSVLKIYKDTTAEIKLMFSEPFSHTFTFSLANSSTITLASYDNLKYQLEENIDSNALGIQDLLSSDLLSKSTESLFDKINNEIQKYDFDKILQKLEQKDMGQIILKTSEIEIDKIKNGKEDTSKIIKIIKIKSIKLAFEDGFIKNAVVNATLKNDTSNNDSNTNQSNNGKSNSIYLKTDSLIQLKNLYKINISSLDKIHEFNNNNSIPMKYDFSFFKNPLDKQASILVCRIDNFDYGILLNQVIFIDPLMTVAGNYIAKNCVVEISPDTTKMPILLKKKSFIDDFDIRIYTDIAGLNDRERTTGLIQTEFKYNLVINNNLAALCPIVLGTALAYVPPLFDIKKNKDVWLPLVGSTVFTIIPSLFLPTTLFEKMAPFVNLQKIDAGKNILANEIKTANDSIIGNTLSKFDLCVSSSIMAGININFSYARWNNINLEFITNFSFGTYLTDIDSMWIINKNQGKKENHTLVSYFFIPEFKVKSIFTEYIDFDFRYSFIFIDLFKKRYNDESPIIKLSSAGSMIHKFQGNFNLFFDPIDRDTWFFTRINLYYNGNHTNFQMQTGISSSISNFLSFGEKK